MDKQFHLREDISIEKESTKQKIFDLRMAQLTKIFKEQLPFEVTSFEVTLSLRIND